MSALSAEDLQGRLSAAFKQESENFEEHISRIRNRIRARTSEQVVPADDAGKIQGCTMSLPSSQTTASYRKMPPVASSCGGMTTATTVSPALSHRPPSAKSTVSAGKLPHVPINDWGHAPMPGYRHKPADASCAAVGDAIQWMGHVASGLSGMVYDSFEVMVTTCNAEKYDMPGYRKSRCPSCTNNYASCGCGDYYGDAWESDTADHIANEPDDNYQIVRETTEFVEALSLASDEARVPWPHSFAGTTPCSNHQFDLEECSEAGLSRSVQNATDATHPPGA